jgi:hypothetical protein
MKVNTQTKRNYRGSTLTRQNPGAVDGWSVTLPTGNAQIGGARVRWGRLGEVCADVDAYIDGTIQPHRRPFWA